MNFAQAQADPRRHVVGIAVVVLFHVLVVYVLVTGLAKKVIDVVRAPIETKVIEEIKKPPPPPEVVLPPPPKLEAPPPPFIPPPEIQIATPPPAPTITATTPTPPQAPVNITPVAPVAPTAPAAPPAAPVKIAAVCPTQIQPTIPRKALQESINGFVKARVTIHGGKVVSVDIIESRPRGLYDAAVKSAMSQYVCAKSDQDVVADQEFNFKITE
jgi:protein TonB